MSITRAILALLFLALAPGYAVADATLTVDGLTLDAGQAGEIVVTGIVDAEPTYGVTILLQIVPRGGNTGTLQFTPAPPKDIVQRGDPWPDRGMFSSFDTEDTGSVDLNGSADDNGTVAEITSFSGTLTTFPVVASQDASGVWDVMLTIPGVDSIWWGDLNTTLLAGTVTVLPQTPIPAVSAWGLMVLILLLLTAGTVVHRAGSAHPIK